MTIDDMRDECTNYGIKVERLGDNYKFKHDNKVVATVFPLVDARIFSANYYELSDNLQQIIHYFTFGLQKNFIKEVNGGD